MIWSAEDFAECHPFFHVTIFCSALLIRSLRDLVHSLKCTLHSPCGTRISIVPACGVAVLAELERSLIGERTRAGVKAAQRRGVKFGRKQKLTPEQVRPAITSPTFSAFDRVTLYRVLAG
jgi:hypothetical protein